MPLRISLAPLEDLRRAHAAAQIAQRAAEDAFDRQKALAEERAIRLARAGVGRAPRASQVVTMLARDPAYLSALDDLRAAQSDAQVLAVEIRIREDRAGRATPSAAARAWGSAPSGTATVQLVDEVIDGRLD